MIPVVFATIAVGCGGGSSPSAPTSPTASISITVGNVTATSERTSTALVYHVTFQLRETGGSMGATITSVKLAFTNGAATVGDSTFTTAMVTPQLGAGSTLDSQRLNVTDDRSGAALADRVTITVNYTANGVAGSLTSSASAVGAPPAAPAPAPAPGAGTKYDGTYDFSIETTGPGGSVSTIVLPAGFFRIRNGQITSSDNTLTGGVTDSSFGNVKFNGPCPINGDGAVYTGIMAALATKNGMGEYVCNFGGIHKMWHAYNGK
jgi:hypothetical protein